MLAQAIKEWFCRHSWQRSRYVNIATGENLGCICTKCGKWKPWRAVAPWFERYLAERKFGPDYEHPW